ncbi:MAG: hypothetical protein Q7T78_05205 [Rhodoferax sp.]|nr:hypothetical protein [Rhodoferax sp.]
MTIKNTLDQIASADLSGSASVSDMATREEWTPDFYAVVLAENIRTTKVPLDLQRERLAALAQVVGPGLAGGQASAEELARHYAILESLFHRFAREAHEALRSDKPRASEIADRYLTAALKAQRAALATLSALKVLRDSASTPTTPAAQPAPAPTLDAK